MKTLLINIILSFSTTVAVLGFFIYVVINKYMSDRMSPIVSGTVTIAPTNSIAPIISPTTTIIPSTTISPTASVKTTPQVTTTPKITSKPIKPSPTASITVTPTPKPSIDYSKPWAVAPNCPVSTSNCIPCTSGSDCRYEPGKTHGFRGWACQNNNPGNIRNASTNMSTDFKNLMIKRNGGTAACGVRYDKRGGSYFVFATYTAGFEGLKAYLKGINNGEHSAYTGCGDCTLSFLFSKYAPGDSLYATKVAEYMGNGVTTSTKLKDIISQNKLDSLANAIKRREGFFVQ